MKIGTALTPSATKALLLGSGELGKEIAISLQCYGVEVIAVDRYKNAPAQHIAQRSHVIDMTDADAVKKLIATEKLDFVIPEIEAIATDALVDIEKKGLTKVIPNTRAVQLTMNREGIRTMAAEKVGVPTSYYAFAVSYAELKAAINISIGYPCFIKPTMPSSGKGQSKVIAEEELKKAWDYAKSGGRKDTGKVIVEGAIDFDYEITLLTVRAMNQQNEIQTCFCAPKGHLQEDGDYRESWQPQKMTEMAIHNAQDIAKKVTDDIGGLGVFGVELFIKADDVWFSGVSPRPHDTCMVTMLTQRQTEFDLHARAILGLPVSAALDKTGANAVILGGINAKGIEISGLDKALSDSVVDVRLFAKPEAFVTRRKGVALATTFDGITEARAKAVKAAGIIQVQESSQ